MEIIQKRIQSIDILRGIAMVLMALDHVRDYFHITAWTDDPLNLETTTPALFFTRFITHFCAPTFVFLSGTSIYLQSLRKTKSELSVFLFKRGLWLIFVEFAIVNFAWTFNPNYPLQIFQVIWTIGISMFILGFLIKLPYNFILGIGLLIVLGHNLLDFPEAVSGFKAGFWWDLLHHGHAVFYPINANHSAFIFYPFLPWTGLMMLGYCLGKLFTPEFSLAQRTKLLKQLGIVLLVLFIILRGINIYGDPLPWQYQQNNFYTFLSFLNVQKYPPSLLYMAITIGMALFALSFLEKIENRFTNTMVVFGRTAFFYYILHLFLIHFFALINYFINGHSIAAIYDFSTKYNIPFLGVVTTDGFGLKMVYIIWIVVILILFPICKWYDGYKTAHKEKWWLSYL
ncbi:DUF1624 domain-containing protein [Flavobacterium luteum]|uniref:DUF1624 domain-containing protein n=1 Tax=Flavobacterium luteum TaxID=2026654 RepID=A0A7J5AGM4_9FLAO|nr:heparan-alpha-glucosaminide N-acetyltransferase domain-containing protein [Flavobacterium luteum]KAB1156762.1 DUF1624 domain-containing protein [Flavobacterium luteum]